MCPVKSVSGLRIFPRPYPMLTGPCRTQAFWWKPTVSPTKDKKITIIGKIQLFWVEQWHSHRLKPITTFSFLRVLNTLTKVGKKRPKFKTLKLIPYKNNLFYKAVAFSPKNMLKTNSSWNFCFAFFTNNLRKFILHDKIKWQNEHC